MNSPLSPLSLPNFDPPSLSPTMTLPPRSLPSFNPPSPSLALAMTPLPSHIYDPPFPLSPAMKLLPSLSLSPSPALNPPPFPLPSSTLLPLSLSLALTLPPLSPTMTPSHHSSTLNLVPSVSPAPPLSFSLPSYDPPLLSLSSYEQRPSHGHNFV